MINYIYNLFKNFCFRSKIKLHNKKVFEKKNNTKNIILIEFNGWAYLHIIKSYIAEALCLKFNAKLIAFESYTIISDQLLKNPFKIIVRKIMIFFSLGTYGVYKSFGTTNFIYPEIKDNIYNEKKNLINKLKKKTNTKSKLLDLKINNIHVGDLFYDTYLKVYRESTIDLKSSLFQTFFTESIILFFWWHEYIKNNKNKIKSIIVVHSVYTFGLPVRIANYFNIECYKPSHKNIIKINKKNPYITNDVTNNISYLNNITNNKRNYIYRYSKEQIKNIVKGKSKTGKNYKNKIRNKLKINNKNYSKKILVSCHSFADAPHVYGKFFKSDFFEWMHLLGRISKKNDYVWLIKPHPLTYDQDLLHLKKIIKNYPKMVLIKKKYSNQEVLNIGIDFALTCFGTISFEYPFLGIKVINFTQNHPYKNFKFSFTPQNLDKYISTLNNLKKFHYKFNKKEIYEYYYLKRVFLNVDYMYLNLHPTRDLDGYNLRKKFFVTNFYEQWVKKWSLTKHKKILKNISNFISSSDYFTTNEHLVK